MTATLRDRIRTAIGAACATAESGEWFPPDDSGKANNIDRAVDAVMEALAPVEAALDRARGAAGPEYRAIGNGVEAAVCRSCGARDWTLEHIEHRADCAYIALGNILDSFDDLTD